VDFTFYRNPVPYLTMGQMVEVDRAMMEDYQIDLIQMMENAGRNLAHLAQQRFLNGQPQDKRVTVLAGSGGNGGGAMVCARHLHNHGAEIQVCLAKPDASLSPVTAHQLDIIRRMRIPVTQAEAAGSEAGLALIIDGLIGYSLQGAPRDGAAKLIQWARQQSAPVLALDVPSGIDATSGRVYDPAIWAAATMTLALPKAGLRASGAMPLVGELYLADISVPPALYAGPQLQLEVGSIFVQSDIVRLL
jgi:NAD(P)H-hydrate epimerase